MCIVVISELATQDIFSLLQRNNRRFVFSLTTGTAQTFVVLLHEKFSFTFNFRNLEICTSFFLQDPLISYLCLLYDLLRWTTVNE